MSEKLQQRLCIKLSQLYEFHHIFEIIPTMVFRKLPSNFAGHSIVTTMKWEPIDIIRLVTLIGGFLLCGLGGWLMWLGVGAEGVVDIKSSVLSGSVKTGSAGLFTLFFGFGIVLFVLATLGAKITQSNLTTSQRSSRTHQIALAFWGVLISFVVTASLGALHYGEGFGAAAAFLALMLFAVGGAYVVNLEE